MGKCVCAGAMVQCDQGGAPDQLKVTSQQTVKDVDKIATTSDGGSQNFNGFGMCSSMGNPDVIKATAAALGVKTPQKCTPNPIGTWQGGNLMVKIAGNTALTTDSKLPCAYGGIISVAGQPNLPKTSL